jgi:hypothetical protein
MVSQDLKCGVIYSLKAQARTVAAVHDNTLTESGTHL